MNTFLKRKPVQIAFLIFSVLLGVYSLHGFVGLTRQMHTRAVERDVANAVDRLEKSPAGIQRAETFVQALKKIDPGYAPDEVKVALTNYISAWDHSIAALKAGEETTQYDPAIARAKQELIASFKKCDGRCDSN